MGASGNACSASPSSVVTEAAGATATRGDDDNSVDHASIVGVAASVAKSIAKPSRRQRPANAIIRIESKP